MEHVPSSSFLRETLFNVFLQKDNFYNVVNSSRESITSYSQTRLPRKDIIPVVLPLVVELEENSTYPTSQQCLQNLNLGKLFMLKHFDMRGKIMLLRSTWTFTFVQRTYELSP